MKEYAELKGDYQKKYSYLESVYAKTDGKGNVLRDENGNTVWIKDDVNIDAEVTADLVGDYLFTDEDFIRNLSAKHQNLFQKVYAEIKYLLKSATAGSEEARKLEKVKKMFDKAYRESTKAQKNTVIEDGVRYALANNKDITPNTQQLVANAKAVVEMESVCKVDADKLLDSGKDIKEIYADFFSKWGWNIQSDVFGDVAVKKSSIGSEFAHGNTTEKIASIEAIPSVIQNGKIVDWFEKSKGLYRITVAAPIEIGGAPYYMGVMLQRDSQNQRLYIHDVILEKEASDLSQDHLSTKGPYGRNKNLSITSILERALYVNPQYFAALEKNDMATVQKLVDQAAEAAGYSVKAYHGTSSDFWTFEKGHKRTRGNLNLGNGFYFAADRSMAENYTSTGRVIDGYLKLENPYTLYGARFYNDDLQQIAEQSGMDVTHKNVSDVLQQMGYDGIIARNYDGNTNPVMQYVVFDPSQIKSADPVTYDDNGKVIPLSERFNSQKEDIRYSLSTPNEDIASAGNFNIHGWDVADFDAPIRDDINVDTSANPMYNENRGDSYARTDEFRSLQAESQRMSAEEWNFYLRGGENETVRRRISAVLQRQMDAFRSSGGSYNGILNLSGKGNQFNIYEGVDPSLFHDIFEVSRKFLRNGELVDLHDVETTEDGVGYNDCYNYLSEDGLSGFSITPDGDLISVFNASEKGGFLRAISDVVKAKAKTLDCYASPNQNLMEMYQKTFGFKTASVMDYNIEYDHDNIAKNHDMPKVAFMVNSDADVELREFGKDAYDEALAYRNSFLDQAANNESPVVHDVSEKIRIKIQNLQTELDNNQRLREESSADYAGEIARLQSEYEAKKIRRK